jgi:hypothetical protein
VRSAVKFATVLMLVLSLGLHWTLLQTVAWTTMLANNLRTHSVAEAMSDTSVVSAKLSLPGKNRRRNLKLFRQR